MVLKFKEYTASVPLKSSWLNISQVTIFLLKANSKSFDDPDNELSTKSNQLEAPVNELLFETG